MHAHWPLLSSPVVLIPLVVSDPCFYYLIMDAARGGDLCDELDEFSAFVEGAAALLMKQLLSCINYLHYSGYVHCDLKVRSRLVLSEYRHFSHWC